MEYELQQATMRVEKPAVIIVEGLVQVKEDVQKLVESMKEIVVTEDTIKTNKQLLAATKKQFALIDAERKNIKKTLLKDYEVLADELKEIEQILNLGERHIKEQVFSLEERQKNERLANVQELYRHYHQSYKAPDWYAFSDFYNVNQRTTLKSVSQKFIRESIINWFESYKNAVDGINSYSDDEVDRNALTALYRSNKYDFDKALEAFTLQKQLMAEATKPVRGKLNVTTGINKRQEEQAEVVWKTLKVKSTDITKALQVLKTNGIDVKIG